MVCQTVKQGGGHPFPLEDLLPFAERKVGRDQRAATFIAVRKDLKQQFRAAATEAQVSQLITDQ